MFSNKFKVWNLVFKEIKSKWTSKKEKKSFSNKVIVFSYFLVRVASRYNFN